MNSLDWSKNKSSKSCKSNRSLHLESVSEGTWNGPSSSTTNKSFHSIQHFAESYAKSTNTFFCIDIEVTNSVIQGLVANKEQFGAPLCPCRYYDNKKDEISLAYWNCPCVPMRERKECHCMLFLTENNEFASVGR